MEIKTEIKDFLSRLKEQRSSDMKQRAFLLEHKFNREAKYYSERIETVDEIINKLEMVIDGLLTGISVDFRFD